MPNQANESSIVRQWEMLKYIPKKLPGISAAALTEKMQLAGFPVSKRTVERDLRDLSKVFPLATDERNIPFGWYWIRDINNDFGGCEVTEAVSLVLAEDVLKSVLPVSFIKCLEQKFISARKKLKELKSLPIASWSSKVRYVSESFPFAPANIRSDLLEKIQKALMQERQIRAEYNPIDRPTKTYVLNPLGLISKGSRTYLIATSENSASIRSFAIQRFRKISICETRAFLPADFSLDKYIQSGAVQFGRNEEIRLKAAITQNLANYLEETKISANQKISWNGTQYILTATVNYSWQFWFWLCSQGSSITVISPKFLRKKLSDNAKQTAANYGLTLT